LKKHPTLLIHGLGATIPNCVDIALSIEALYSDITLDTQTYTVKSFYEGDDGIISKERSAILITIQKHTS
jgi:hypothetical protein